MPNLKKILASLNDNQLLNKCILAKIFLHLRVALLAFRKYHFGIQLSNYWSFIPVLRNAASSAHAFLMQNASFQQLKKLKQNEMFLVLKLP